MFDVDINRVCAKIALGNLREPPSLQTKTERTQPEDPTSPIKRISLELARQCNLLCLYCYSGATATRRAGLTDEEVRFVIDEAVESGARLISIVGGGEPLLRPSLAKNGESCIDYANQLGAYCCLYTNCTLIDDSVAKWLYSRDVTVVGKLNSLREDVQDNLAGITGSALRIRRGIDALIRAGFADKTSDGVKPRFALQSVICRQNYDEIPSMWRWIRQHNIVPEIEIPTLHGRAGDNRSTLYFSETEAPRKYREIFEELLRIDRAEFGYDWIVHPPFPGSSCRLYYSNCYVNDEGGVQPCAGVDQPFGFLRVGSRKQTGQPLGDIVRGSAFEQLRKVHLYLKGKCQHCDLVDQCYGCRAAAWHKSGDIFAEDPVCWRGAVNSGRK
jgi:radical SAM protein with 4Fe4S-binding SPASM domain